MSFLKIFRYSSCLSKHCTSYNCELLIHPKYLRINGIFPPFVNKVVERYKHTGMKEVIVYNGPLSNKIQRVKWFSIMTSIIGLCAQPIIYQKAVELTTSTSLIIVMCSFVGAFTFVTPLLLNFVTKKYVTVVTHNPEKDIYSATVYTLLLKKKIISIKPGEAIVPDVLGLFTTMTIRGIPLFIDVNFFNDVMHYKRIMGYDKPMDFKLGSLSIEEPKT